MFRCSYLVFAAVFVLAGCNFAGKGKLSSDDSSNPHYKQAQQDLNAGNPAAAASDYEAALAENPKLVQAHYELGVLYGDKLGDPISSIYHFKRYLQLDPASDKKDQVQQEIDQQGQAFAASLPASSGSSDAAAKTGPEVTALRQQLADALHTISRLQTQLAQSAKHHGHFSTQWIAGTPPAASTPLLADASASNAPAAGVPADGATDPAPTPTSVAPAVVPPRAVAVDTNAPDVNATPPSSGTNGAPAAAPGASRSYTVVKGDSLWKIAHKMYPGDTKNGEDKIRDANKDAFSGKFLKPGQVLIIPQ